MLWAGRYDSSVGHWTNFATFVTSTATAHQYKKIIARTEERRTLKEE